MSYSQMDFRYWCIVVYYCLPGASALFNYSTRYGLILEARCVAAPLTTTVI